MSERKGDGGSKTLEGDGQRRVEGATRILNEAAARGGWLD